MRTEIPLLQNVRVAAPCHASWDAMTEVEGDRVKFCSECQKRVYNLSAMGQAEAEGLLRRHEGHLCVRYYRRRDGTILTTDCPVGLKAARAFAVQRARVSFTACLLFCAAFAAYRAVQPPVFMGGMPGPLLSTNERTEESVQPSQHTGDTEAYPVMGAVAVDVEVLKGKLDKRSAVPSEPYGYVEKGSTQKSSRNKEK